MLLDDSVYYILLSDIFPFTLLELFFKSLDRSVTVSL